MILSAAVRVVAVATAGILAGIYLGHRAGPQQALHAVPASSFVQFQQVVHTHYVVFMPPLVLAALLSALTWLVLLRAEWRSAEFWLVAASILGIVAIAYMTRAVSVPLNNQLMTWNVAEPPPDLHALWAPWEAVNTARAYLATAALVFEAVALNLRAMRG